jgi:uncharacterized protein
MHSGLYHGRLQHGRLNPKQHKFRHGMYMAYLDLDELPDLLKGGYGLGRHKFSPASFLRSDHLGDPDISLIDSVRDLVEKRTKSRPKGPIRILTLLRNWGYYFCPLSLYYCFDSEGKKVDAIVGEVTNTPWKEQHWYVFWKGNQTGNPEEHLFRHSKDFHVSPFMGMDMFYEWRLPMPGKELNAGVVNYQNSEPLFEVNLVLKRRELNRWNMFRTIAGHPWMTRQVALYIYWQAFRLWRKKTPYFPHPKHDQQSESRDP